MTTAAGGSGGRPCASDRSSCAASVSAADLSATGVLSSSAYSAGSGSAERGGGSVKNILFKTLK